jgi:hypothetical protein
MMPGLPAADVWVDFLGRLKWHQIDIKRYGMAVAPCLFGVASSIGRRPPAPTITGSTPRPGGFPLQAHRC